MHWFKRYTDPPKPVTFMEKFYSGRDSPKAVSTF